MSIVMAEMYVLNWTQIAFSKKTFESIMSRLKVPKK